MGISRNAGSARNARKQTEAIEFRHHHVGKDQIRRMSPRRLKSRLAVGDRLHIEAAAEQPARHTHACPHCHQPRELEVSPSAVCPCPGGLRRRITDH